MDTSKLGGALQELRKRRMYVGAGVLSAWAVLAALGVMVLFVWIDLAIDLPANLRIGSRAVALVAAASVVFGSLGRLWQELKVSSMARKLDGCVSAGGQVVSGVDLMIQPPVGSALRIALAELAVDRAEAISHTIPSKSVVPAKPAYTAMGLAAGCILLLVTLSLVFPRIARTEWMRFIDPHGDHPPYSQIELAVEPGDARVIYGGNLEVFVKPDGGAVDRVELLVYSAANAIGETLPLFPEPQGRWRTTLTNITSDMRYTARAHSSRTRQFDVSVITVPKIEEVRFKIAPPEYTNLPPYSGVLPEVAS
ncbi:MAG: hypothetical protein IPK83_18465 [Planctomycetes bacterium]|nr:hypothetical protein [Planctomycetota bacterium]